jgi:hypothetical protein
MKFWHVLNCALDGKAIEAIQHNEMHDFIPGLYKREFQAAGKLCTEMLTIRSLSIVADTYEVEILTPSGISGSGGDETFARSEKWIAAYHLPTRQLVRGVEDMVCSFVPEEGLLFFRNQQYSKVKGFERRSKI